MPKYKPPRPKIEKISVEPDPSVAMFLIDTAQVKITQPRVQTTIKTFQRKYPLLCHRTFLFLPDDDQFKLYVKMKPVTQEYFRLLYVKK